MPNNQATNNKPFKWIARAAWALPALYFILFIWGLPLVNVSRGHSGIVLLYGKPIAIKNPGWSARIPLTDVVEISNQAQTTTFTAEQSPTHDLQEAKIDCNSQWSLLNGGTLKMYEYYGGVKEIEQALIIPGLHEVQKALSAKYDAYDLQQKAPAIAEEAKSNMTDWVTNSLKLHGLPNYIDVATVLFPHVEFSPEFAAATTAQTTTEQSIGRFDNERNKAITDAKAEAAANIRQAEADAHQTKVNADAEAGGIIAKANALKANPNLPCYMLHKGWDGKMPDVSNGQNPLPFAAEVCKGQ